MESNSSIILQDSKNKTDISYKIYTLRLEMDKHFIMNVVIRLE